ncbi:MAG: ribonuclease J [Deltaproteobacteria bacterium]|nr:MAG: ribonuclease J [Deltaproteobacteria bacterium]
MRIVPLGGLGEFGLNCMVLECGDDAIAIDCGVMFPESHMMGVDRVIPDVTYLHELGDRLKAFVLTHGHEDHIGALPYVLPEVTVPVFATPFTRALLESRLEEHSEARRVAEIERFDAGDRFTIGGLEIEALRVTHSTVDACGLAVRAGGNLIVHTGDFKLDPSPLDGRCSHVERFRELGEEGVHLLLSDSTNAEVDGRTESESRVPDFLRPIFESTRGRVYVTTFSSHIHRMQTVAALCREFGRALAIVGRSMESTAALATRTGHLTIPGDILVDRKQAERLAPRKVCVLATGSQGEPGSALMRLAMEEGRNLSPGPGDAVVFSSRVIPGNERAIGAVIDQLYRRGAEVYYEPRARVHVSGHARRGELREMIEMVRPAHFVPLHGEYRNLVHHRRLAVETGVAAENAWCLVDGEVLELSRDGVRPAGTVPAGRVYVDGAGVGEVDDAVLRDRRHISADGVVLVILGVARQSGRVVSGPDIVVRGLPVPEGDEDFGEAKEAVLARVSSMSAAAVADLPELQEEVRLAVRRYFRRELGLRPVVVPFVMEL